MLRLTTIVSIVSFVVHDQFVLYKVETIRLGLKWMTDQFLHCIEKKSKNTTKNDKCINDNLKHKKLLYILYRYLLI